MFLLLILFLLYNILIFSFTIGWLKISEFTKSDFKSNIFISVIIPIRNEEKNILNLINDLECQKLDKSKFEVIIVDDNSTDNTYNLVKEYVKQFNNFKIIENGKLRNGKKVAIEQGIKLAKGDLIATTDGDCRVGERWLSSIYNFYCDTKPKMIVAPVILKSENNDTFFSKIQTLEFLSLIASGAGSCGLDNAIMCNGANLIYEKSVYKEFNNPMNDKFVSGDDIFLMLAIKNRYPKSIKFLKSFEAVVYTKPQSNLKSFINQRLRWTSKSRAYKDLLLIITSLLVFTTNFSLAITFLIGLFNLKILIWFAILFIFKSLADFVILYLSSKFFRIKKILKLFLPLQFLYFWYVTIIALFGNFVKFTWKDRNY